MNKKMKSILINSVIFFSIIFTVTTLISSSIQLIGGQLNDTNIHILLRAGFVLAATLTYVLYDLLKLKNRIFAYLITYVTAQLLVFGLLFILSFFEPLHPAAYTDAFFNFTFVAIPIMAILASWEWRQNKV